jgi:1,2-phenylacetyl-CoA epoxidase PaaB subunit
MSNGEGLFDVFGRPEPGKPSTHLGSVAAPDEELARLYATQLFGRRGENHDITVAVRGQALPAQPYARVFEHHAFRSAAAPVFKRAARRKR